MVIECKSCEGTGVYVGMAERNGAAVICTTCNGTGKYNYKFEYNEFTGLKTRENVTRVYKSGYGYVISPTQITFEKHGEIDMSKEGVSYEEFLSGKTPNHIKQLICPMVANQSACHDIKSFVDECERLHGGSMLGMYLSLFC